jgi:hypothetical protein
MKHEDLKKHAELLISMSTDFLMGGLSDQTFYHNVILIGQLFEGKPEPAPAANERSTSHGNNQNTLL